jgi:hypothetical protein
MSGEIHVINIKNQPIPSDGFYFYIGRSKIENILSNPFTSIKDKSTLAKHVVNNREESIEKYREYFDMFLIYNKDFQSKIDEIYNLYVNENKIYLGCFCKPLVCHGDVIKEYIEKKHLGISIKNKYYCNKS